VLVNPGTREKAKALLAEMLADEEPSPTFGSLLDDFLRDHSASPSIKTYRSKCKPLRLHFGHLPVADITKDHGKAYRTRRTGTDELSGKVSAFTAELELSLARQILNAAWDDEKIPVNPLARLKKRKKLKTTPQASLQEEHLADVIAAAPNLLTAVYILVAFDTGGRRTEVLTLQWEDIYWSSLAVKIRHGKGDKDRLVVTTARALEAIRRLPRVLGNPFVFANPRGRSRRHYGSETLNDWCRDAVVKSGVEQYYGGRKVRIHALRRGHATNAIERGVDIRSVQEQLGHASLSTTEKYIDSRLSHRLKEMRSKYDRGLEDPLGERHGPRRAPCHGASENASDVQSGLDTKG
jgi:integrase